MKSGIRAKIIRAFVPAALVLVAASVLSYGTSRLYFAHAEGIFGPSVRLNRLIKTLEQATGSLEGYLSTRHFESLNAFLQASSDLRRQVRDLSPRLSRDEGELLLRDISALVVRYVEVADAAMSAKRSRDAAAYVSAYRESQRISSWIERFTNRYNRRLLDNSTRSYLALTAWVQKLQLASLFAIVGIALLDLLLLVWLTWRVTNPLVKLSEVVNQVNAGTLDATLPVPLGNDEVAVLARAYRDLLARIQQHVGELKDKAQLQQLLREAELHALQAQINPHFIFNTLNAGMQLAMFENAGRTATLLGDFSRLLRYNLRDLDLAVTLNDELQTSRAYIRILKTRFADLLEYREVVDPDVVAVKMPALVLQPLIENAWIHGLSRQPTGGVITVSARRQGDQVVVTVADTGQGLASEPRREDLPGQSTGIGLANVRDRLKLFFGREDGFDIHSTPDQGTVVTLTLGPGAA